MVGGPEVGVVDDPVMFRQGGFRLVARLRGLGDLRADEGQVGRLREFAQRQDEPADDLVEWLARDPGNRERFERALSGRDAGAQNAREPGRGAGGRASGHGTAGHHAPASGRHSAEQDASETSRSPGGWASEQDAPETSGAGRRVSGLDAEVQGSPGSSRGVGGCASGQDAAGQSVQESGRGAESQASGQDAAGQSVRESGRGAESRTSGQDSAGQNAPASHNGGMPPELRKFFDTVEATPYWVDRARLERGARAITRAGLLGLFPLGDMSLMGGYLASRATKALVGTGEIEYRATRRLVETAAWWMDVTTPGAMERGRSGFSAAVRIRVVHAYVRRAMNGREDWDYERWDRPVNQVQTAGTLLLFSLVYVFGTQLLGVRYSEQERADILHLWRYIGWLMGVDEELLPADEGDAWRLLWLLAATEFIPDEDSKRLAKALVESHAAIGDGRGAPGKVLAFVNVRVHSAISRLVLGKDNADFLELPDDPLAQVAVVAVAGVNFAAETARRFIPGATAVQELLGGLGRRRYLKRMHEVFKPDTSYGQHMRAA